MKVFIDASVILAALGSVTGGSSEILKLIKKGIVVGITSGAVLEEVLRNSGKIKVFEGEVIKFISGSSLQVLPAPASEDVEKYFSDVAGKDAHIVAAAINCGADIVITLDKKHLLPVKIRGLNILTQGEFLKNL